MANATDVIETGGTPRRERVFSAINKASGWLDALGFSWLVPLLKIAAGDTEAKDAWKKAHPRVPISLAGKAAAAKKKAATKKPAAKKTAPKIPRPMPTRRGPWPPVRPARARSASSSAIGRHPRSSLITPGCLLVGDDVPHGLRRDVARG